MEEINAPIIISFKTRKQLDELEYKIADICCFYSGFRAAKTEEQMESFSILTSAINKLKDFRETIQSKQRELDK